MKATKKKIFIIVGSTVALGTLAYILYNRHVKKKQLKLINDQIDGNVSGSGVPSTLTSADVSKLPVGKFPLKLGQQNQLIFKLQKALNKNFRTNIVQDGRFGDSTAKAMCSNVWTGCFTDLQARNYTVTNEDYNKALKGK